MKAMKIEGIEIGIRTFHKDDIIPFYEAVTESILHMKAFMPWCNPKYSIKQSEEWVKSRGESWSNAEEYSFICYSLESHQLLGGIGINQINQNHKIGNIGYWVRKSALNRGVATEAVSLVVGFGFEALGLNRLEIVTLPNNIPSRKVAEKSGAILEGVLHNRLEIHGKVLDACMYSIAKKIPDYLQSSVMLPVCE
jgi:RimJ/RimL family protein N-acetyltransferase